MKRLPHDWARQPFSLRRRLDGGSDGQEMNPAKREAIVLLRIF